MAGYNDDRKEFEEQKRKFARELARDTKLQKENWQFYRQACSHNYEYLWNWMGVPIIQTPADIMVTQEIIWETKPQLIIETGIARGGSVLFYASLMETIGEGRVVGIDIDIRAHNRDTIENHPVSKRVDLIQGSSIDDSIVTQVRTMADKCEKVMVILDSNHTHEHVLAELEAYAPMVTKGQFLIVADTSVDFFEPLDDRPRPWGQGDNPKTAMDSYLKTTDRFERDAFYNDKLIMTSSPEGYLRCIKA
ncbi:CmcI family methyltransferase [uncultured Pseudodesulfovibrio sp.]|uniref:cephalosporin hydroxylase family protein n=1 Tax=uncultured Pseudodesulfovibrio sp. TaxID=2035858 RepID=UPI0029C829A9|nr:CmcI family methyltransferase [uncultured Pseudodesulfovibrio sp.]